MFMLLFDSKQLGIQWFLIFVAFISVPWMLLAKPLILKKRHEGNCIYYQFFLPIHQSTIYRNQICFPLPNLKSYIVLISLVIISLAKLQGSAHHRLDDVAQDADEEEEEDQSKQGGHGGHGHGSEVYIHLDRYSLQ